MERVQRRATRTTKGLETCVIVISSRAEFISLPQRWLRGDMVTAYTYLHGGQISANRLFNLAEEGLTRSNGWKLKLEKLRWEIR